MQCLEQGSLDELAVFNSLGRSAKRHWQRLEEGEIAVLARVLCKICQEVGIVQNRPAVVGKGVCDIRFSHQREVVQRREELESEEPVLRHRGHVAEQSPAFHVCVRGGVDAADICWVERKTFGGNMGHVAPVGWCGLWGWSWDRCGGDVRVP